MKKKEPESPSGIEERKQFSVIPRRVALFVDGANFQATMYHQFPGMRFSLRKYISFLRGEYQQLVGAYYYDSVAPETTDETKREHNKKKAAFLNFLRYSGYIVRTKPQKGVCGSQGGGSKMKGNCDVELAVDVIMLASTRRVDEIIIFSGDGDFAYLAKQLRDTGFGMTVTVLGPERSTAAELKDECDRFISLESLKERFMHAHGASKADHASGQPDAELVVPPESSGPEAEAITPEFTEIEAHPPQARVTRIS